VEAIGERIYLGSNSYLVESADSQAPTFLTSYRKTVRKGWQYPLKAIKYSPEIGSYLWRKVSKLALLEKYDDLAFNELVDVEEPYRSNLHSFLVNIWSYVKSTQEADRDVPPFILIERSLKDGPSYAKYLDGQKSWLMTLKFRRENFSRELEETYGKIECAKFKRIGDIYRANQLFFWLPPNPDIEGITSVEADSADWAMESFRAHLREYLQSKETFMFFKPNNDYRTLLVSNTKAAYEGKQWMLQPTTPATKRDVGYIAFIPRELKESRAAVVETQASSLRIRWINSEVAKILRLDKRSAMETRPNVLLARLKDSLKERKIRHDREKIRLDNKSQRWSYCRDFKKEGLTKNRELLRIMLEELSIRFPSAEAFEPYWFFDQWSYELAPGDTPTYAARGHGLGMANALTTLMQIVIEEMTKSRMAEMNVLSSFYNNDDAMLVFPSRVSAVHYADFDRNTCSSLGLDYKEKSTFLARGHGVFCELYVGDSWYTNDKTPFAYAALANMLKAVNGSHARFLSLSMNIENVNPLYVKRICEYWGPVLFSNEFTRPRALGGWFRSVEKNIDISFANVNGLMWVPQMEEAANYAYLETRRSVMPWRSIKAPTKRSLVYPTEWLEQRDEDLFLHNEQVFKPDEFVKEHVRSWERFEEVLKKNFSKSCSWWAKRPDRRRTYSDIYRSECDKRPKEDILPPVYERDAVASFEAAYTDDVEIEHPYRYVESSVDLQLWRERREDCYTRRMGITASMTMGAKDFPGRWKGPRQRAITLRKLLMERKVPLKIWNLYLVPSQDTFKYWHYPFSMGAVADAIQRNYSSFVPRYVSEAKQKLLDMRDQWYGRPLLWHEWLELGTLPPQDIVLAYLFKECWNQTPVFDKNDRLLEVTRALKRFSGFGSFLNTAVSLRYDDVATAIEKWWTANLIMEQKKLQDKKPEYNENELKIFEYFGHGDDNPMDEKPFLEDWYFENEESDIPDVYEKYEEEVVEGVFDEAVFDFDPYPTTVSDGEEVLETPIDLEDDLGW